MSFLKGKSEYKGYTIQPAVVCFDIRYFVFGESFEFLHYKDINEAKKAIDKYIIKKRFESWAKNISEEFDIEQELVVEYLKEVV